MKKEDFENKINEMDDSESKDKKRDELPDFIDYLQSDEYVRSGADSSMPMKVSFNGEDFQVYVKPLTSQQYYRIQLDSMNKQESLDLLACQKAMVDKDGNPVSALLIENLKAGTIQDISAGIRLISGIDTEDMDYAEIMEYFLKN